ncbi:MAG: carboxypeptidase-like regulatory domain-containing protein [Bacteroidota bacterium]
MTKYFLVFILTLVCHLTLLGQTQVIKGRVIDLNNKRPVPYASVGIVNSSIGTATNDLGEFELKYACPEQCTLKISSIGYKTYTLVLTEASIGTIALTPSPKVLKEVVVRSKQIDARKVVKKAFRSIKKNYLSAPLTFKSFYRHYSKEDTAYIRLIEAAFDMHYKRGYSRPKNIDASGIKLRLTQLRRSLDVTGGAPYRSNYIKRTIANDIIAYQGKRDYSAYRDLLWDNNSLLKRNNKDFVFELSKITELDGQEVYEILFSYTPDSLFEQSGYVHAGKLYITMPDYAIVRYESSTHPSQLEHNYHYDRKSIVQYKKYDNKYVLFHIAHDRTTMAKEKNYRRHTEHIEVLINEIVRGKNEKIHRSDITREDMIGMDYDPSFWEKYTVLKANPLESKIIEHLQKDMPFSEQFLLKQAMDRKILAIEKEAYSQFNHYINEEDNQLVFVSFWTASRDFGMKAFTANQNVVDAYRNKGVKFVHLSIDSDRTAWENSWSSYKLDKDMHLWIGRYSPVLKGLGLLGLPRYLLYKRGKLVMKRAPAPGSTDFGPLLDRHLKSLPNQ